MHDLTIRPTIGYGTIRLGITRAAAQAQLGDPDRTESDAFPGGSTREQWSYSAWGCALDFDSDDDWLLGGIDVQHPNSMLSGVQLIGMQEPVFLNALARAGMTDVELDEEFEFMDSRTYWSDRSSLFLWVECGSLQSVSIFPRYDASGEMPVWPSEPG